MKVCEKRAATAVRIQRSPDICRNFTSEGLARMKVLQIGASWFGYQLSGLERYYTELVSHLPLLGLEVTGVVYELKKAPNIEGLSLVSFGTQDKSLARKFLDQRRIVKSHLNNGIDLVVSHCTPSLFPSLRHLGQKPLICHFHGPRYLERTVEGASAISVQLSKYIEHKVYARADHIITLSHYMKRVLMETYAFSEQRISVIPGGVNIDRFKPTLSRGEARRRLGLTLDRPIFLTVRRLARRMGLHNLIDAMGEVARAHRGALLLIAGKGALRAELEEHIASKHLSANIQILGAITDETLPLLYRAADFSIVPTISYEGFGLILLESLASGTPVLGTPVGAIPEVLAPLSQSLLLEDTSYRHIAEGVGEVLSGRRKLPSMEACQRYATENYAWPIVVSKINVLYQDVVGRRIGIKQSEFGFTHCR
jgi:glycosyltransferase involved in cell wall biosynthesis